MFSDDRGLWPWKRSFVGESSTPGGRVSGPVPSSLRAGFSGPGTSAVPRLPSEGRSDDRSARAGCASSRARASFRRDLARRFTRAQYTHDGYQVKASTGAAQDIRKAPCRNTCSSSTTAAARSRTIPSLPDRRERQRQLRLSFPPVRDGVRPELQSQQPDDDDDPGRSPTTACSPCTSAGTTRRTRSSTSPSRARPAASGGTTTARLAPSAR